MSISWYTVFNWLTQVKKINPGILSTDVQVLIKTYPEEILELQEFLEERKIA